MANTYHQVFVHVVFAVKFRRALLDHSWRNQIHGVVGALINENKGKTLIVNGMEDHLHCLLAIEPAQSISEMMKVVKAKSSKYINDRQLTAIPFAWQKGFGVFSCAKRSLDRVYQYINNQEAHHKKKSFLEEYVGFLEEFEIEFDPKYIFEKLV